MRWHEILKQTSIVTPPNTSSPIIPLDQIKWHCRDIPDADITDFDQLYTRYCNSAELVVESLCERAFRSQTRKIEFQEWPSYYHELRSPTVMVRIETIPVLSITHLKYYDSGDDQVTLDPTKYESWLNHDPPLVVIRSSNCPILSRERTKAVEVQFVCGYTGAIPENAALAILELIAFWRMNPESEGRLPVHNAQSRVFYTLLSTLRWRPDIG